MRRNQIQCQGKHCKANSILTQLFLLLYLTYSCYSSIRRLRKAIIFNFKISSTPEVLNIKLWFCRSFVWWLCLVTLFGGLWAEQTHACQRTWYNTNGFLHSVFPGWFKLMDPVALGPSVLKRKHVIPSKCNARVS